MLSLSPLHDIYQQECTRCESHTLSVRTACKHLRHDSWAQTLLVYWNRVTTAYITIPANRSTRRTRCVFHLYINGKGTLRHVLCFDDRCRLKHNDSLCWGYRQCVSVSCMHCVAHLGIGAVLASLLPPPRLKYCSVCTAMECDACAVIIPVSLRLTLQCIESNGSPRVLQVCTCQSSYAINSTILPPSTTRGCQMPIS